MTTMRIDFVRHGETEWNRLRRVQGRGPTPLNERGRAQAARLGDRYHSEKIDALYASGLVRAMQTVAPIEAATGRTAVVDDRVVEVDQGELEGMDVTDLHVKYPEILRLWLSSPDLIVYPSGEAMVDVQKRMLAALADFQARHQGQRVVVVSHQFALNTLFCALLEMPLRRMRTLRLSPGSVTTFEWSDLGVQLASFNSTRHLADLKL